MVYFLGCLDKNLLSISVWSFQGTIVFATRSHWKLLRNFCVILHSQKNVLWLFQSTLSKKCFMTHTGFSSEWRWRDSNSWPPACKAGALPTELHPHLVMAILFNCLPMGLSGLEPPTSRLSGVRSNRLSYKPNQNNLIFKSGSHLLSHTVSSIVSSAVWVLTIVFGMCTGVSPKRIATRINNSTVK